MIRIAHANKKQACIDEAWLYKTDRPGVGQSGSESAEIMRRDAYSFWEPLDRKFMTLIYQLAVDEHVSLLSFFWSSFFYGNLQYTPEMENISYKDFMHLLNQRSYGAIRNSNPTKLGEYLNTLAKQ